ncbi:MAG: hypothetical protein VYC39_08710 [Myxococcota bacterium]|nr:hypothetical protein [Myxococcota bacterium]
MTTNVCSPSSSVVSSTPNYTPAERTEPNMCVEPPKQCTDGLDLNVDSQRQAQTTVGQTSSTSAPTEAERSARPAGTVRAGDLARDSQTNTSTVGWAANDRRPGYLHGSRTSSTSEEYVSAGGGLRHVNQPDLQADVISGNGQLGVYDGRIGARGDAQLVSVSTKTDSPLNVDAGVLRANGAIEAGEDGFTVGGSASIIEGGVTLGDATPDASDSSDTSVRLGAGAGLGLSARGHWADSDNDGVPESGFGFDIGPVSMDVRSESLGQVSNYLADSYSELAGHGPSQNRGGHYTNADAYQQRLDNMAWYKPWTWSD